MVTCMTLTVDWSVGLLWLSIVRSGLRVERDRYAKYIKNVNKQLKLKLERKLELKRKLERKRKLKLKLKVERKLER